MPSPDLGPTPQPPTEARSPNDDYVLWVVIAFCLVTPVVLVVLWTYTDRLFPPMLIAVLPGIAIAALTYRYLGGTGGSEFSVGVLKVAGSSALLIGTAWFANKELSLQMAHDTKPNKVVELQNELSLLKTNAGLLESENIALKNKVASQQEEGEKKVVSFVKSQKPDSFVGEKLQEMIRKREGPFSAVKKSFDATMTFVEKPRELSFLFACESLGLANERLKITRIAKIDNDEKIFVLDASQSGVIESAVCNANPRKFDLQMGCEAGLRLFPDEILGCSKDGVVKWRSPSGSRRVQINVEVFS